MPQSHSVHKPIVHKGKSLLDLWQDKNSQTDHYHHMGRLVVPHSLPLEEVHESEHEPNPDTHTIVGTMRNQGTGKLHYFYMDNASFAKLPRAHQ